MEGLSLAKLLNSLPYDSLAESLISRRIERSERVVKVDHLAFSFKLSELRFLHKIPYVGKTKFNFRYPKLPEFMSYQISELDDFEAHKAKVNLKLSSFYQETLKLFVDQVLGFQVSCPRDKGFHGYSNSMTLKTRDNVDIGFVGIGGQQDTVYIQISGTGCKYLFDYTNQETLHYYLSTILGVSHLSRIDLARDDYDNNFNCDYAVKAYKDGWFRTGKGGKMPFIKDDSSYCYDNDFNKIFDVQMWSIGKRTSPIYWRIYNKKLEQSIDDELFSWYRTEVELKKWSVEVLLNPDEAFAGINQFSQSMTNCRGIRTKSMNKSKEAALDIVSRVRWVRRACGKALGDILAFYDGDISFALGLILPDESGGKLGIPSSYRNLINFSIR